MSRLILGLDLSLSMRQPLPDATESRLDRLKQVVGDVLRAVEGGLVVEAHAFVGLGHLHTLGSYSQPTAAAAGLADLPGDLARHSVSSALRDFLAALLRLMDPGEPATIVLITDGDDQDSTVSWQELLELRQARPDVDLQVFDLVGEWGQRLLRERGPQEIGDWIRKVDDDKGLSTQLRATVRAAAQANRQSLPVSAPIVPLYDCGPDLVEQIHRAMQRVVPFVEQLTELRYYPVTTYLVAPEQMPPSPPGAVFRPTDPGALAHDFEEIWQHVWGFCISIHRHDAMGLSSEQLSDLRNDGFQQLAEILPRRIRDHAEGATIDLAPYSELWAAHAGQDVSSTLVKALEGIVAVLARLAKRWPEAVADGHDLREHQPDLDVWRRHLGDDPATQQQLRSCVDDGGNWRLDAPSVATAARITADILWPLVRRLRAQALGAADMRLLGQYRSPRDSDPEFDALVANSALASWFRQPRWSGRVLLCPEYITARQSPNPLPQRLLILDTLLHEHMHAALREGVNSAQPLEPEGIIGGGEEAHLVNEALAEWTELDFFRDEPRMHEAVLAHAKSGPWPDWPYAGALKVEAWHASQARAGVQALVKALRSYAQVAHGLLAKGPTMARVANAMVADPVFVDRLSPDCVSGHVFPAPRLGEAPAFRLSGFDFWHNGGILLSHKKGCFRTHIKYASRLFGDQTYVGEAELRNARHITDFSEPDEYAALKANIAFYSGPEAQGVAGLLSHSLPSSTRTPAEVVALDVEIGCPGLRSLNDSTGTSDEAETAQPGDTSKKDRAWARIDLLLLNKHSGALRFYEVKHFSNPELWDNRVIDQVKCYEGYVSNPTNSRVSVAYYEAVIESLRDHFGDAIAATKPLHLDAIPVALLVFGLTAEQRDGVWQTRRRDLAAADVKSYGRGGTKNLSPGSMKAIWNQTQ